MNKKILAMLMVCVLAVCGCVSAFAAESVIDADYKEISIGTAVTTDENGEEISSDLTLANFEYFDMDGNPVDISEAIEVSPALYDAVTHKPNVELKSGYMMRYGDYYCVASNAVTLSCKLNKSAKVAFGYSYTSDPNHGGEVYAASSDSKSHSKVFNVPSTRQYKFYCTNISPSNITLKEFKISY